MNLHSGHRAVRFSDGVECVQANLDDPSPSPSPWQRFSITINARGHARHYIVIVDKSTIAYTSIMFTVAKSRQAPGTRNRETEYNACRSSLYRTRWHETRL